LKKPRWEAGSGPRRNGVHIHQAVAPRKQRRAKVREGRFHHGQVCRERISRHYRDANGFEGAWSAPRSVQGFLKKDELMLLHQRRATRRSLASVEIESRMAGRFYQARAIRRIGETFEKDHQRNALLVMATGSGKTRTVIALIDQLMRANWVKRALFLADRIALVNQAVGAFKTQMPYAAPVNLVTDKQTEGRVFVSTYPTMAGLLDEVQNSVRRFDSGHFDLIVIDETHRSVYRRPPFEGLPDSR
jgi:type I site-specific restriction endonuclease